MSANHPSSPDAQAILVLTQLPDLESANKLAEYLVAQKLAACVNMMSPNQSIYVWQGETQRETEIPLLIKSSQHRYPEIEAAILQQHPYELPEIIRLHVDGGYASYLQWLVKETS